MPSTVKVTNVSKEEYTEKSAAVGMGQGVIDNDAKASSWLLQGDQATIDGAKAALKGRDLGAFVMYTPPGEPHWTLKLLLKGQTKKSFHYTVLNGPTGFHLKGTRVSTPTLSEFVQYYSEHGATSFPHKLVPWGSTPVVRTRGFNADTDSAVADGQSTPTRGASPPVRSASRPPRKRALLIAISYHERYTKSGDSMYLPGCLYDTHKVKTALIEHYHYTDICTINEADVVRDKDNQRITESPTDGMHPTRDNIVRGMEWLLEGVLPGDQLFAHFAGHGSHVKDLDGDEFDGRDEVLVPVDFSPGWKRNKLITDDEIFARMITPLPEGAALHFVIDTCHSGSLTDLEWMWDGGQFARASNRSHSGGLAICLSGCTDQQESTDATNFDGKSFGVLTKSWLEAVTREPRTHRELYSHTSEIMANELEGLAQSTGGLDIVQNPRISFTNRSTLDEPLQHFNPTQDLLPFYAPASRTSHPEYNEAIDYGEPDYAAAHTAGLNDSKAMSTGPRLSTPSNLQNVMARGHTVSPISSERGDRVDTPTDTAVRDDSPPPDPGRTEPDPSSAQGHATEPTPWGGPHDEHVGVYPIFQEDVDLQDYVVISNPAVAMLTDPNAMQPQATTLPRSPSVDSRGSSGQHSGGDSADPPFAPFELTPVDALAGAEKPLADPTPISRLAAATGLDLTASQLNHLSFLNTPGNEVAFNTLVGGLGEGWLTVNDLLHHAQLVPAVKSAAVVTQTAAVVTQTAAASAAVDWRSVTSVDDTEKEDRRARRRERRLERERRRKKKERKEEKEERRRRRDERRRQEEEYEERQWHRSRSVPVPAYGAYRGSYGLPPPPMYGPSAGYFYPESVAPMAATAPAIHVHIKNGGGTGAQHRRYAPSAGPGPTSTVPPPPLVTSSVKEEFFTEEYIVNDDGTEVVLGRHPAVPPAQGRHSPSKTGLSVSGFS